MNYTLTSEVSGILLNRALHKIAFNLGCDGSLVMPYASVGTDGNFTQQYIQCGDDFNVEQGQDGFLSFYLMNNSLPVSLIIQNTGRSLLFSALTASALILSFFSF